MRGRILATALAGWSLLAAGCGESLQVSKIGASARRPANVALYLKIADQKGQPVPGLAVDNFRVYEDGKLISPAKGKRALVDASAASGRLTLVMVDLSGPITDSQDLPELAAAVGRFVEKVGHGQAVAVSVFDGADSPVPIAPFGVPADPQKVVAAIRKFRPRSRNSNLNGAVFQGLATIKERLDAGDEPTSAAMVVYTDRGDLAHSVNGQVVEDALKQSPAEVYVIGVGAGVDRAELAAIGHSGIFISLDPKAFKRGFEQVAAKITGAGSGRYIFSYCTPKRRNEHVLKLEVEAGGNSGTLEYHFNADSFHSGCSPGARPSIAGLPDAAPAPDTSAEE
ncbi:MAG TPA: vWA domain-containing protein [Polyangia bacterium]|nr:vWA domain-containing protein [Polyangia bacterium]